MRTRIWHRDWKPRWLIRCVSAALLSVMDKQEPRYCVVQLFPSNSDSHIGQCGGNAGDSLVGCIYFSSYRFQCTLHFKELSSQKAQRPKDNDADKDLYPVLVSHIFTRMGKKIFGHVRLIGTVLKAVSTKFTIRNTNPTGLNCLPRLDRQAVDRH